MKHFTGVIFTVTLALVLGSGFLSGDTTTGVEQANLEKKQDPNKEKKKAEDESLYYEVTVTATSTKRDTFETPKPVSVVNSQKIAEAAPNNVTDLLTELPGVDVNGVGANQSRPIIRGLRGQRILLMEDGIRMNNSRRQQDFGEIPGMVDIADVDRVEVVRGPASTLYGSDAIGGVINIISKLPGYDLEGNAIHGSLGYRYSSAYEQNKGAVNLNGHIGRLAFIVNGNYRKANDYFAPAGSFGDITLAKDARVLDTGIKDYGYGFHMGYNISRENQVSFKYDYYNAANGGFGLVEPELYNPGDARIQILYPMQKVRKYTFNYENSELGFLLADNMGFKVYHRANERDLSMNIWIPFNIPNRPQAGIILQSDNYTDVRTTGFRLELNKGLKSHIFTYGLDLFVDNTKNTDKSTTTMVGFGPPQSTVDNTPQVPNASYRSMGVFFQDDISLFNRTSLILGVRYQDVNAKTRETVGLEGQPTVDSTDRTIVGTANLLYSLTDNLRLVFSAGRGFRSPNLIERFFNGTTPEGSGFQSRNLDLKAETSLNFDLGFKYRRYNVYFETTVFNNVIFDGIRIAPTGKIVNGMPEYQNVNVDKLRMRGVEVLGKLYLNFGVTLMANYTYMKSKDLGNPEIPYVDTYSSKINCDIRYDHPGKLFYVAYHFRHNGNQKDVQLGENPIGPTIPGFTVHSLSAGITFFRNSSFPQQIGIVMGNLTNELYSEFSNASFFRPAPKRHIVLTWAATF
jgi:outer membrane receptor protein involved in Fe transport